MRSERAGARAGVRRRTSTYRVARCGAMLGALAASALLALPGVAGAAAEDPAALVNPFIGTENFGNAFPGASMPFGMVQVSPDNGGQGGYDYKRDYIHGFSQTHLSGVGCGVLGELPIMPTTGAVTTTDQNSYRSQFSHAEEQAEPGYYQVRLARYDIDVELTATARSGWQRYTFPETGQANVLFNTARANMGVQASHVEVVGDDTVEGWVAAGGFCAGRDRHRIYFSARFDRPFAAHGTWKDAAITPGSSESSNESGANGAWVSFDAAADREVVAKIGVSYTGQAGARANLAAETAEQGFDFGAVRAAAHERWEQMLGKVEISGGERDRRVAFYTALYHALMHPNAVGDSDGSYMGFDGEVHHADDYEPMANFSLWDTYRPQNQLLELLVPGVARDVALSLLAVRREGGWLPRWELVNSETNIMTGDPVTPFLVENWSKGLLAGHEQEAYAALRENATGTPPEDSPYNGRNGNPWYTRRGYVPSGLDCVYKGGDNDCSHPASATLEYAAADASLALMAAGLGHDKDARMFADRGQNYRNLWDARIGTFRPRMEDGSWIDPYDPATGNEQFHESGAYQYQWLVPQDPAGMIGLLGGKPAANARLDEFFAYEKLLADPARTVREEWVNQAYDYYGATTYNPNNEPDLLSPYTYLWTGEPYKTATIVRAAETLFTNGPDGMTGNDDLGTMSAWYVFTSLGLYPTMSGANFYGITSPQFPEAKVEVGDHGHQGGTLVIAAPDTSADNRYIAEARLDGAPLTRTWVRQGEIARGGRLEYRLDTETSSWGTRPQDAPPSVNAGTRSPARDLAGRLSPAQAFVPPSADAPSQARFALDLVVAAPRSADVTVTVAVPSGFTVEPQRRTVTVDSDAMPTSVRVPVTVTVPAGTPEGGYPVVVTARMAGVDAITRTAAVVVREGRCAAGAGAGAGLCPVDLSRDYNHDGVATLASTGEGNFDGSGWSFAANLLPAPGPVTLGGIPYEAPPTAGTEPNFVEARGQSLALPDGHWATAYVLGATHNGNVETSAVVTYADGTSASVPLALTDWAGQPQFGNTTEIPMPYRIRAGQGQDGPPVAIFGTRLALDPSRTPRSVALPGDPRIELYGITLGAG
jgi:predicted alpha-1,2-mannosidase